MSKKCLGILIVLSHARHVIPLAILKGIVEIHVLSTVRYCLTIYDSSGEIRPRHVRKIADFAARVVTG